MSIGDAILLGLVQGITEFLPVSSSGHLSIISNLFGMSTPEQSSQFFDVLLHFGTLISIFVVYWGDIVAMFRETLSFLNLGPQDEPRRRRYPAVRQLIMILMATLPLVLILPVKKMMDVLYTNSYFIGVMIILTGCMLYVSDKMLPGKKTAGTITVLDAVLIGICQCVATIPGLSRSGTTITAGIATGVRRDYAVKFSFLMSIPAVLGANLLNLVDAFREGVSLASVPAYLIGMAVAMVAGIGAISLLRYIADKGKFGGFAYYCWVFGVLSIILTMIF